MAITEINKNIPKKCDLCGSEIMIDVYALGSCSYCGWANVEIAIEKPDRVYLPNYVSFDRARQLYAKGLSLKPSFDEFLEALEASGHIKFSYKGRIFEATRLGDGIGLFDTANNYAESYDSFREFRDYAIINGKSLQIIWGEVEKVSRVY